ncbi:hypothetical protein [Streptomyces massasporeus]|uniref:hypothetical protein n=1 Tax=Streptomyces massasporeus TaxID=67324 RepID=UPI003452BFAF
MGCQNRGDKKLAEALAQAAPDPLGDLLSSKFHEAVETSNRQIVHQVAEAWALTGPNLIVDMLSTRLHKATLEASDGQTVHFIGDIGEAALRIALESEGHEVLQTADRHAPRRDRQHLLDLITRLNADWVHEIKTAGGKRKGSVYAKKPSEGVVSLTKPQLSKTKSGVRQGSAEYVEARLGEIVATAESSAPGAQPQVLVHKIDLRVMKHQSWSVNADGTVGEPTGPPRDCLTEVAEAMLLLAGENEMGPEP